MVKRKYNDLWGIISLFLLPLGAIALIYISTTFSYEKPDPSKRGPMRLTPEQSLFLNRPVSANSLALGDISEQDIKNLVEKMESLSKAPIELLEKAPDTTAPRTVPSNLPVAVMDPVKLLPAPALAMRVLAGDLKAPDGLALDPRNGNIYVSEEDASRIIMITPKGKRRTVLDGEELLPDDSGPRRVRQPALKSPEGLAMDAAGNLYIVEDRPGGRLIKAQCEESGRISRIEIIQLPGKWEPFAWEAVAVSARGEILLGGSSAEGQMKENRTLFQGALLYRDVNQHWWALSLRPASGISSVSFSGRGDFAIYTDEINGTIGWIDLATQELKEGASVYTARSPEGVVVMPDGRLVVAEERGRLVLVDPRIETIRYLQSDLGSIESLAWDAANRQLLVTSDSRGEILAFQVQGDWGSASDAMAAAPVLSEGTVQHIPEDVPEFLTPLIDLGLANTNNRSSREVFAELTRKVPIMAADSRTTLIYGTEEIRDPIVQLVFVAVAPNGIMTDDLSQEFAVSAVILRTRSGQVYRSKLTRMAVLAGNMISGKFDNLGSFDLPIPFAYQAEISTRGHAVIHFAGLGQSPDVSIAINPEKPDESFMVVSHMTGVIEQYRLERALDGTLNNWVVSLPPKRAEKWTNLQSMDKGPKQDPAAAGKKI